MPRRLLLGLFALLSLSCNAGSCTRGVDSSGSVQFDGPHALTHLRASAIVSRWPDGGLLHRSDGGLVLTSPGFRVEGEMSRPICDDRDSSAHVRIRAWYLDDVNARRPDAPDLAPGSYAVKWPWGTVWPPMHQAELEAELEFADGGRAFCGATAGSMTFVEISPTRLAGTFDFSLGTDRGADAGELTGWFDVAPGAAQ